MGCNCLMRPPQISSSLHYVLRSVCTSRDLLTHSGWRGGFKSGSRGGIQDTKGRPRHPATKIRQSSRPHVQIKSISQQNAETAPGPPTQQIRPHSICSETIVLEIFFLTHSSRKTHARVVLHQTPGLRLAPELCISLRTVLPLSLQILRSD